MDAGSDAASHSLVDPVKPDSASKALREADGIIKPANDELEYRIVNLDNGIRAVLVSDPTTDKAAASMEASAVL